MKTLKTLGILCLLASTTLATAQEPAEEAPTRFRTRLDHEVSRATSAIKVDGELDEQAWADATSIPLALEWFPGDNAVPPVETVAYVTYDDRNIYVAFRCLDPEPDQIRANLMDRDQINTFVQDDHVTLMFDTFNDERRAFQFRVNPLGVQADAIFSEVDGIEDFSWDMIWSSKGKINAEGWIVELALPVNQLRFQRGAASQTWGIELGRSWPRRSRHRMSDSGRDRDRACLICQFDKISGLEGLEPGRNLEINPTVTGVRTDELDDFPDGDLEEANEEANAGLTARWGITPDLTLLGTINPDFSQVEADVAQLNVNERFTLFFEEKRPFFLEGIDFFSTPFNAVFTRTVIDPDWGGKLTGKIDRNAVGVFFAEDSLNGLVFPSNQGSSATLLDESVTSGVLRYRYDVGATSTIGVLLTGREGDDYHNRVGGIDGFLRLNAKDSLTFQYLRSDTLYADQVAADFDQPTGSFSDDALEIEYQHAGRKWFWGIGYEDRGPDFRLDSGFMPRVDTREAEAGVVRTVWGDDDDWYDQLRFGASAERTEDHDGQLTDQELEVSASFNGPLQSFVQLEHERNKQFFGDILYDDLYEWEFFGQFQPSGVAKVELYALSAAVVDFNNNQPADETLLNPAIELKLGRHVNARIDHVQQKLDVEGGELFEANLTQLRLIYNFNVRSFVRAIFQRLDLEQDPELFVDPVEPEVETLFTQLLFSYRLNARTVLFVGYSDNQLGLQDVDLTRTDRTLFMKIGYAWIL